MNKRNKIEHPLQDEQDKEIDICSKGRALEFMIGATQLLAIMRLVSVGSCRFRT